MTSRHWECGCVAWTDGGAGDGYKKCDNFPECVAGKENTWMKPRLKGEKENG